VMPFLAGLLLAIIVLALVLLPFFRKRQDQPASVVDTVNQIETRRDELYQEMRTLQQDFDIGNIAREDYESRIRALRLEAALTLREQRELEGEISRLDTALEKEISAYRSKNGSRGP